MRITSFLSFIFFVALFFSSSQIASAAACASPNTCETVHGDCPGGRSVTGDYCGAGKLCCAPSTSLCNGVGEICRSACDAGETSISTCENGLKCCKAGAQNASVSIEFQNPLSVDTVEGVLGSILSTLRGIIVVLSLVFIVLGAILYIVSAGDEGRMKTAKGAITASMIGLAIGIAAPSFLRQIGDILGWTEVVNSPVGQVKTLTEIALSTLQFLLSIVGILGLIMLVIGGLAYITAGGDEKRSETGKKIVTYAIIGIFIALASLIIVTQIATLFSA